MANATKSNKVAIYDPYINTLGGGEKYLLTIAELLLGKGFQVDLYSPADSQIISKAEDRFFLNLKGLQIKPDIFKARGLAHTLNKFRLSHQYQMFIFLNDGSIPFLFSKNNILHIQVPFNLKFSLSQRLLNQLKLKFYKKVIVNSQFTKQHVDHIYGINSTILYPPIDLSSFTPATNKQNIILSVGRFDNILNAKKQDVMLDAFIRLYQRHHLTGWKYVLIGGSILEPKLNNYLNHLIHLASGFPVEFHINANFSTLVHYYSLSKLFWHAAGYQVEESTNPQQTEHFGMSTVEAMSAGLVPLVVNKGGQKEIVTHRQDGYLWNSVEDLIKYSQFLIGHPQKLLTMAQQARQTSQKFSKQNFIDTFSNLFL